MTLKYAGIAVVIFTCTAAGFMKSLSLSRRVKELETFISALSFIATEIRYFASNFLDSRLSVLMTFSSRLFLI